MLYRLKKKFAFEASHQLKHHDGKCANLHGHSWNGVIEVVGEMLFQDGPKENMLIDYADLSRIVKELETQFDHKHLNEVFMIDMPTSEFLAGYIFRKVNGMLPDHVLLQSVTISETCTTECTVEAC